MKRLKLCLENRADLETEYEKLVDTAKGRELTSTETSRLDEIEIELGGLDVEIKQLEEKEGISKRIAMKQIGNKVEESEEGVNYLDFQIKRSVPVNRKMPATDFVLRNFDIDEKMQKANCYDVIAGLAGRKYPAGSVTDYALEQTKRSLTSSALLNPFLSAQLLDGGLSRSRLVEAGMKTFVMNEATHKFARIAAYPTLEWKAELGSTTERTVTFDAVTFAAKTLRGWIQVGGETLMDALNIQQALRNVFSKAIANGIDTAGIQGAGGVEPLGIANYVGVPTLVWNNTIDDYDLWVGIQKLIYDEDGPDINATIMSTDAWSQLARLKGTNEKNPMQPPPFLASHKFLQTSKIQPVSTETLAVTGDFGSLNLGVRLEAEIVLTPVIAETFSYKMLAVFRGDFQPNRVEDFGVITKIDAAPALT